MAWRLAETIETIRRDLDEEVLRDEELRDEDVEELAQGAERETGEPAEPEPVLTEGKIIAFVSGKGGVGKSSLAINVANFCAENGHRVLLVDCDLNTNGATAFFSLNHEIEGQINGQGEVLSMRDIITAIAEKNPESIAHLPPVAVRENYDFIPATIEQEIFNEQFWRAYDSSDLEAELVQLAARWRREYNLIILDMSAGESKLNILLTKILSRICIVMTPGELSRRTVRKRLSYLFKMCNLEKIVCCVNMIQPEQWVENQEALFDTFGGFAYSEVYNRKFKKGEMIDASDRNLYRILAYITEKCYENSKPVLDACGEKYGISPHFTRKVQDYRRENLKSQMNSWLSYWRIALRAEILALVVGAVLASVLDVWQRLPSWAVFAYLGVFFAAQAVIAVRIYRIWSELY